MSRVITFSRTFPSYHPRAGESTFFVEQIYNWHWYWHNIPYHNISEMLIDLNCGDHWGEDDMINYSNHLNRLIPSIKSHTIRSGHKWKVGDWFSPRVWSGKPYHSKQIIIAPDIQIKKIWDFEIIGFAGAYLIDKHCHDGEIEGNHELLGMIAANDGLSKDDFVEWFDFSKSFTGQIICWNEKIEY